MSLYSQQPPLVCAAATSTVSEVSEARSVHILHHTLANRFKLQSTQSSVRTRKRQCVDKYTRARVTASLRTGELMLRSPVVSTWRYQNNNSDIKERFFVCRHTTFKESTKK